MIVRRTIPVACPVLSGNEERYVRECLQSSWISSIGKFVDEFEQRFASFCQVPHAIGCTNGTAALHLALTGLGVAPGDEVIVPTLTYVAAANAVHYCGATPVFVDSEPVTMNLDPAEVECRITDRTKAIIAVHLYGHPADMHRINEIAGRRGIPVIEDAAEAHGALCHGRRVGGLGRVSAFSFFGNKIITTGEGGMVTTPDADLADRIRILRGQGMDPQRRYWFPVVGFNYRITNIQAAIGVAQMESVADHLSKRREVATLYGQHLSELADFFQLPVEEPWATHSYWMYTIVLRDCVEKMRDDVMSELADSGIETRPVFYPMHQLPPYREADGRYPVAEHLAARGINLPTHSLLTEDDIAFISKRLAEICTGR